MSAQQELVRSLGIRNLRVVDALTRTDRKFYAPINPYLDEPQFIGSHGETISAPHMHAAALEHLAPTLVEGAVALTLSRILTGNIFQDVGSGSGYLTAAMARMVGPTGLVIGVERSEELVSIANRNVKRDDCNVLRRAPIIFQKGDGWQGAPSYAPFDAIHVGAAATALPTELTKQLARGGRLFIPIGLGEDNQQAYLIQKDNVGAIRRKRLMAVKYVPLVNVSSA